MKRMRLFTITAIMIIMVFAFVLSSPVFKLKIIQVNFLNAENKEITFSKNKVYNTSQKIDSLIDSAGFNYNSLIFLIDKKQYINKLENKNPYLKLVNISTVFPNKLIVWAKEREKIFCVKSGINSLIIDSNFKILEISELESENDLIEIKTEDRLGEIKDYYSFFNILPQTYESGQVLTENNLIFKAIQDIYVLSSNICLGLNVKTVLSSIIIKEQSAGKVDLKIETNKTSLGMTLQIEDILQNFKSKYIKLISALNTLYKNERIKTTYGTLFIDKNHNCYWNNL